jgi:hypothetical protein
VLTAYGSFFYWIIVFCVLAKCSPKIYTFYTNKIFLSSYSLLSTLSSDSSLNDYPSDSLAKLLFPTRDSAIETSAPDLYSNILLSNSDSLLPSSPLFFFKLLMKMSKSYKIFLIFSNDIANSSFINLKNYEIRPKFTANFEKKSWYLFSWISTISSSEKSFDGRSIVLYPTLKFVGMALILGYFISTGSLAS